MFYKKPKIAVIGAGVGGLATAIRLAGNGFEVELFEKNPVPGGKMSQILERGYRFDTGPSLFTMPLWLEQLFESAGASLDNYLRYSKLDPVCRYIYEDGTVINAHADPLKFAEELYEKAGENTENTLSYLRESEKIYHITNSVFLQNSIHLARNYLRRDFIMAYLSLPAIRPFEKLHRVNRLSFTSPKTIQLFDRFATYNGSSPYKTPATLMVIPHLEHNIGAYFPRGGIFSIARAIEKLALELGVKIHYQSPVSRIIVAHGRVRGVEVNGETLPFDLVVSDADLYYLYTRLLGRATLPKLWFSQDRSTSALIFYWGMNTTSPGLDLHNILFSSNYADEFHHLFDLKQIIPDPTVYIFISSKIVKEDAPPGKENWFVMINAPENTGQDWDQMVTDARYHVKEKIMRMTGINPDHFIETEHVLDPRDIEERTSSHHGSLYGNSSNSIWAAFRRHPNIMPGMKGLYLVGGSVHPGGGIPLCLSSAKIVAEIIDHQFNKS
jgi:phytoene desaturase